MPYTPDQFANNSSTTVAGGSGGSGTPLNPSDTTLHLPTGAGASAMPSAAPFNLLIGPTEIAKCSLKSGDTLTIARGQEGTTAGTWPVGTTVQAVVTAGSFSDMWGDITALDGRVTTNEGKIANAGSGVYYAVDYGVKADGVTDDGAALRSMFAAIQSAGGGRAELPAGTLLCSTAANPEDGTQMACAFVPAKTLVCGRGRDKTIIRMANSQGTFAKVLLNWHISSGGDEQITVRDLTLDGNAANQSNPGSGNKGAHFFRARWIGFENVKFVDVYGTSNSGNGEGFHTSMDLCSDIVYSRCECAATSTNTAAGFSANQTSNIAYLGCSSHNMGFSHGFTHSGCVGVTHTNCYSYLNGQAPAAVSYGFNTEQSNDVLYTNCRAGGYAIDLASYPFNEGASLGNSSNGFTILGATRTLGNPQFAPSLVGSGSGGTLAAGIWNVAITWVTSGGETQIGPTAQVTTSGTTSSITVTVNSGSIGNKKIFPAWGATGYNVYVSSAAGGATLLKSNGSTQTGATYVITAAGAGAAVPASNTATYTAQVGVKMVNCVSSYNGGSGVLMSSTSSGFSNCSWTGGEIVNNGVYGFSGGAGDQMKFKGGTNFGGNTNGDMHSGGADHSAYGNMTAPGVPATNTALLNPHMVDALVYVNGGTLTAISVGTSAAQNQVSAATNTAVVVPAQGWIKLNYSVAPTWTWTSLL